MLSKLSKEKYMTKIIIDCDPGVDDAIAILLALASPEIKVLGSQQSLEMLS